MFDYIYHEHFSYFSIASLDILYQRNGLAIFDVKKQDPKGGSVRVYAKKLVGSCVRPKKITTQIAIEKKQGWYTSAPLNELQRQLQLKKANLLKFLTKIDKKNSVVIGTERVIAPPHFYMNSKLDNILIS